MSDTLYQPTISNQSSPSGGGHSDYQHQTWTFHNTAGLLLMSALAFGLLVMLLRQQARYHELVVKTIQHE